MPTPYDELEQSKYIVWVNCGHSEGWIPVTCSDWNTVMSEIRSSNNPWLITKPVVINEPVEKVNNLR